MICKQWAAPIFFSLLISSCKMQYKSSSGKFRGMWKLDKFESLDNTTGKWNIDSIRVGYSGYILYDGQGHMGVQEFPPGYRDADMNKSIDSLSNTDLKKVTRLYKSNFVYFGEYSIDKETITHKRLSATNPKDWNTVLKRNFEFRGDTLLLTTQEIINGSRLRIRWIRF